MLSLYLWFIDLLSSNEYNKLPVTDITANIEKILIRSEIAKDKIIAVISELMTHKWNLLASVIKRLIEILPTLNYLLHQLFLNLGVRILLSILLGDLRLTPAYLSLLLTLASLLQDSYEINIGYLTLIQETKFSHFMNSLVLKGIVDFINSFLYILPILIDNILDKLDQSDLILCRIHQFFLKPHNHILLRNEVVMQF